MPDRVPPDIGSDAPRLVPEETLVRREHLPLRGRYVAPRTPTEMRLAEIWRGVLSMDRVGVEDSYRDLGGDSLLASLILTLTIDAFAVPIRLVTLFETPTVASLASRIDAIRAADGPA